MRVLAFFALVVFSICTYAEENSFNKTKSLLVEWIQVEESLSKERSDWSARKAMLQERIRILELEKESLSRQIKELGDKNSVAEKRRSDLLEKKNNHERFLLTLASRAESVAQSLQSVLEALPPVLSDLYRESTNSGLNAVKKAETIVEILSEIEQFDNKATLLEELRMVPSLDSDEKEGSQVQVATKTLYLGLSQAYYVSTDSQYAGIGYPGDESWVWENRPELASKIKKAIAIHQSHVAPKLINLPVTMR